MPCGFSCLPNWVHISTEQIREQGVMVSKDSFHHGEEDRGQKLESLSGGPGNIRRKEGTRNNTPLRSFSWSPTSPPMVSTTSQNSTTCWKQSKILSLQRLFLLISLRIMEHNLIFITLLWLALSMPSWGHRLHPSTETNLWCTFTKESWTWIVLVLRRVVVT